MWCRGPWLHWHHWSSGGTDTKGRARRQKKGWHRRGLDTGNAGVAAGSSPSRTEEMWKESHKLLSRAIGQHGLPARVDTPQCRSAERTLQGLLQELPALTHVTCPSSLSPFPVHVSTLSTPLLRHANSPLPKAAYFSTLPPPPCSHHIRVCVAAPEEPEEACGEAPTATAAPNSPSSPLPSPVPPPFTFLKCSEGVETSCLSQLSLACAPRRFQLARNVSALALCSIVPACLFPQTSIVHYSR